MTAGSKPPYTPKNLVPWELEAKMALQVQFASFELIKPEEEVHGNT
jgi:hypothetical protein